MIGPLPSPVPSQCYHPKAAALNYTPPPTHAQARTMIGTHTEREPQRREKRATEGHVAIKGTADID